ncbi:hypothetical protein P3X46_008470 [Hevea brasiliensis]|uniref:Uncharacterized protein n=2 Tax=Hevea brasiliensis TaxID=3981 RepID=A0ABQ9MIR7_HEVBR|nr:uncharacterized protein LOC110667478 [Hevea brasiliensis]KAF2287961.1 hypothetical protein GH714_003520 [Hevea brasiliensis]KAJ9180194.1 hypothetical protein P3X46_008470 [Hevea brasiliensis]
MAYPSEHYGLCSNGALRIVLALVATFLVGYIVKPQLYSRQSSSAQTSCPCDCDCSEEFAFSLPLGFVNSSYADCGNHNPDVQEEMEKDIVALLSEEIDLQKRVANDSLEHTRTLVMDARKASLHYQKEAEKCNAQTETCEGARERAEAELVEEYKHSALWEKRARELGWEDSSKMYT